MANAVAYTIASTMASFAGSQSPDWGLAKPYTLFNQRSINLAATTNLKGTYHTQTIHPFVFLPKTLSIQVIKQGNISPKTIFRLRKILSAPDGIFLQKTMTDFASAKNLIFKSSHFVSPWLVLFWQAKVLLVFHHSATIFLLVVRIKKIKKPAQIGSGYKSPHAISLL